MREILSILVGLPLFFYLVFNPLRSKLLVSTAFMLPHENKATLELLNYAHSFDPCDAKTLMMMGDMAEEQKNTMFAVWSYGQAMVCSPADALIRIKYGEALIAAGFNGSFAIKEALLMEPNNKIYQAEVQRITTLQLPSL